MLVLKWKFEHNSPPVLEDAESLHGSIHSKKSSYIDLLGHLIRYSEFSDGNFKAKPLNFLEFLGDIHVKSVDKQLVHRYNGKLWVLFKRKDDGDYFKIRIPPFFWISYPNLNAIQNSTLGFDQPNVMAVLFSSIADVISRYEGLSHLHPGSFITSLESRELLEKSKPDNLLNPFYREIYFTFYARLTQEQIRFIEDSLAILEDGTRKDKSIKISVDSFLISDFLEYKGHKKTRVELYFAWLFTLLTHYLNSKEIPGLDHVQQDLLLPNLQNYEKERILNLCNSRIKLSRSEYQVTPDHRVNETSRFLLTGTAVLIVIFGTWFLLVSNQRSHFILQPGQLDKEITSLSTNTLRGDAQPLTQSLDKKQAEIVLKSALMKTRKAVGTRWTGAYFISDSTGLRSARKDFLFLISYSSDKMIGEKAATYLNLIDSLLAEK
ncbi:MAG: hypothetical protein J0L62_03065 [Bacteroidetes bacterium]|nr:hypothetical protein [Bacteroidota bacterium]